MIGSTNCTFWVQRKTFTLFIFLPNHWGYKCWTYNRAQGGGTEEGITLWCIWEKCSQLLVFQQHISEWMGCTYGLWKFWQESDWVPYYHRFNQSCLGIKHPTNAEKPFNDVISTLQHTGLRKALRHHSDLGKVQSSLESLQKDVFYLHQEWSRAPNLMESNVRAFPLPPACSHHADFKTNFLCLFLLYFSNATST